MSKEALKVLTESMFYVLLSLLRQERCGTEIVQFVEDTTVGRVPLGPGTLYTILGKFQDRLKLCVADGDREEGSL